MNRAGIFCVGSLGWLLQQRSLKITGVTGMWTKPAYKKIRLGFEITMYFQQR